MKHPLIPAMALVVALAACGGGNNTSSQSQQSTTPQQEETAQKPEEQKSVNSVVINFVQKQDSGIVWQNLKSITVYGADSLVVDQNGKKFSYTIDKSRSSEAIKKHRHHWDFVITRKDPSSPDYTLISVPKYRDDLYNFPHKKDWEDNCTIEDSRCYNDRFSIDGEVSLAPGLLSSETLFPEIVFNVAHFNPGWRVDTATLPEFITKIERLTVKGNTATITYGGKTECLQIIPFSDYEITHSEHYYGWTFTAKKDTSLYVIEFGTAMDMPDDVLTVSSCKYLSLDFSKPNNEGYTDPIGDCDKASVIGCENLKPRLCRRFPDYQECRDVADYFTYDGEEGEYYEEPKPPTPPDSEKIKAFLTQNVPALANGTFEDDVLNNELTHISTPDQNGNCAVTAIHWYPVEATGKKWKIYVIGLNANASDKFLAFMYTPTGITETEVEKELTQYSKLGYVGMYSDGINIHYYQGLDYKNKEFYWYDGTFSH